ncbi:MAG: hypothetical protein GW942_01595 [Candidatus Pacebacteria bacterium]|nr:hypothetical protein [Candidatus Paceibacterota bacterium]
MAIKRTKKQKLRTSVRREETLSYSIDEIQSVNKKLVVNKGDKKETTTEKINNDLSSVFNQSYVAKDLFKTLIVAVLVVGVLVAYTIFGQ